MAKILFSYYIQDNEPWLVDLFIEDGINQLTFKIQGAENATQEFKKVETLLNYLHDYSVLA